MDTAADDTVTDGPDGTGERPAGGEGARTLRDRKSVV